MQKSFHELIVEFNTMAEKAFPKATVESCLVKLEEEIKELRAAIEDETQPSYKIVEEYIDAIMCLLFSARRAGFDPDEIVATFQRKIVINRTRQWKKNNDNTYSHI